MCILDGFMGPGEADDGASRDTLQNLGAEQPGRGTADHGSTLTGTPPNPAAERPTVGRFALTVIDGPGVGKVWESRDDRCSIGSNPLNDVVIDDATVSRFHCELVMEEDGPRILDLRSRNGTIVNGMRVRDAYLRGGSMIRLGRVMVRFDFSSERNRLRVSDATRFGRLVGTSTSMRAAFALLERAAGSDTTVLLEGETGTGKSQAAEGLHTESSRAAQPFVVVDCASIPSNLLESELFGHERGAFTGAEGRRIGAFEEADGGTIFLDEIGELPTDLQPKLLRALENRQVRRIGANTFRHVDVRLIAATNRDLRAEVNAGRFRSDLYFRLAVVKVRLPSLRDRSEDLPDLVRNLLAAQGVTPERIEALMTPAFLAEIMQHTWPGNVRELRNYVERCILFDETVPVSETSLGGAELGGSGDGGIDANMRFAAARTRALAAFERAYVTAMLQKTAGDVAAAAEESGLSRVYVYKLIKKHRLKTR